MGSDHKPGVLGKYMLKGRKDSQYSPVIHDISIFVEGNIEINPDPYDFS
jgi:hypothetical protein